MDGQPDSRTRGGRLGLPFQTRLTESYGVLTDAQRQAADYVARNPVDVATRPLRSVSRESGVSPSAFSRMSRALDYDGFEELREELRLRIGDRVNVFADRARRLQETHGDGETGFFDAHLAASQANLATLGAEIDRARLMATVERLAGARRVVVSGALGSTGVVEYLSYMANYCFENWSMAGRMGASMGGALTGLDARDALIVVTMPPFAERTIRAVEMARGQQIHTVVITDSYACPALAHADDGFIVPTASPHFFSSYVATLFFVETLIGLLLGRSGDEARDRIARVEGANRVLAEAGNQQNASTKGD